jgi:hypothetical protein
VDSDGHAIGTLIVVPISGNGSSITGTVATGGSITNSVGLPALSIVMGSGADLTITGADLNSSIKSTNAAAFQFGTIQSGSIVTLDWAGEIAAVNGDAVVGLSRSVTSGDQTVKLTFQSTALVNATGTTDAAGVPVSGGGVVLSNLNSAAMDWTVTNHGQFRTSNDGIVMVNLAGSGSHSIVNDGYLGTDLSRLGGAGAWIGSLSSGSNGTITNDNGEVWATGNGGLNSDLGGLAVVVGGEAKITNVNGLVDTVNDTGILAVGGSKSTVNSTGGSVTSKFGPGIIAGALGGAVLVDAGEVISGADDYKVAGFSLASGGVLSLSGSGSTTVNLHDDVTTAGTYGALALSLTGAQGATVTVDKDVIVATTKAAGSTGILAAAGGGNAVVNANATSDVRSTSGPGIVAVSVTGTSTVDAGKITSGNDPLSIFGISLPVVPGLPAISGGAIALSSGDATLNAHNDIETAGAYGALAVSLTGNTKVTVDEISTIETTHASGTGVMAVSLLGDATVGAHALSEVKSQFGPGIVGLSIAGTSTVDAGIVTSGAGAVNLLGLSIPGLPTLSGGTMALSLETATLNAHNDITTAGTYGALAVSLTSNAAVNVDEIAKIETTNAAGSTGVLAVSLLGDATVNAHAKSEVVSASGPGVVGLSLTGKTTIDAGKVNSGDHPVNLLGFALPAIPGVPSLSGGVLGLGAGDVAVNLHGDVITTGTFGGAAISLTGAATIVSDEGITVDPPVGMFGFGPGPVTVTNNGTQNTTLVGLLGVNLGGGTIAITNSQTGAVNAASGAGVVAIKVGTANNTIAGPDGTFNTVAVRNDNTNGGAGGVIDAPNGPGVFVLALDPTLGSSNNVLVANTNHASITGAGGPLDPTVGVLADGDVRIDNDNYSTLDNSANANGIGVIALAGKGFVLNNTNHSTITGNVDVAALGGSAVVTNDHRSTWTFSGISAIGASNDASLVNDHRSQINGTDSLLAVVAGHNASISNDRGSDLNLSGLSASLIIAGNDASIHNNRGGSFNMDGVSANIMVAAHNASITNERGGSFNVDGIAGGNFMVAGNNASITNDRGGDFTMSSLLNANVMVATADTTISNDHRGTFSLTGLESGNFMVAGGNASISNDHRGSTTFANLVGANVMIANGDASITNQRGGDFTMLGLVNGNVMVANNGNASITNDFGGDFTMAGLASGNVMVAGNNASITNNRGGSFSMIDLLNGNVMIAQNGDATITNERGGDFTLAGINGNVMVAANGNASITNNRHAEFNLLGLTGSVMVAKQNATISNSLGGTISIVGASGDFMVAGGDITIDNDSDAVINFRGVNTLGFVEGGSSALNNNSVVRVAGLGNIPGITRFLGLDEFNNAGELTMMTNVIGDVTYTSGDYVGGDGLGGSGLLSQDVYLDGAGGSSSDLLYIDGQASGTTLIAVNDLHGAPGTYDPIGTKLVFAYTAASGPVGSEFALRDGPMDYGLYTYDLKYYYTADDPAWFLANGPNDRAFELATIPSQIQNMVATLDSTWHDRTADLRDSAGTSDGGGGVWLKAVGSYTQRDYNQSFTDSNGTYTYNGHSDQKIGGLVGGADVVISTDEGLNVLLGVTGSYLASSTDYRSGSKTQIAGTGIGAYATVLKDGFFMDAIGRVQFLGINHTTAAPWSETVNPDAKAYSVVLDAGYRGELGAVTVEPMATLAYNRVIIDSFNLLGNTVSYADQDSLRGRLGVRVSSNATGEGTVFKPFLEANVWSQFMGNNSATISGGAVDLTLHDNTAGLSGEVKGGFDVVADTWSGFVSAQVNKSELSLSAGAQAGVRVDF